MKRKKIVKNRNSLKTLKKSQSLLTKKLKAVKKKKTLTKPKPLKTAKVAPKKLKSKELKNSQEPVKKDLKNNPNSWLEDDNLGELEVLAPNVDNLKNSEHFLDIEPSEKDISLEESLILEEESENEKKAKKYSEKTQDVLATYMESLSKIPLFTPTEEIVNAKKLESLEKETWYLVLHLPDSLLYIHKELNQETQNKLYNYLQNILEQKANKEFTLTKDLTKKLASRLRHVDFDKELLEKTLYKLKENLTNLPKQFSSIEKSRNEALNIRNNFVKANLRLVVSVARNFHHFRIPFIDLIQEGNMGLMKAVHRFDHKKGFRFSTYAHWWIRQSIERAIINKGSQVRLPVHVIDSKRQVTKASSLLTHSLGRLPTPLEIAEFLKISLPKVEQLLTGLQQDPVSLEENISDEDPRRFVDLVKDELNPSIDEILIDKNTKHRLHELLQLLNPIERDIIQRRFGLIDDIDHTLDEIGKTYNLSRERVRQIQTQGLNKMKRMCERRKIS